MADIVSIRHLSRNFGKLQALRNVSFDLKSGEIIGLLGLNGAGKSTTLSLLTGRLIPDEGSVTLNGIDALKNPVRARRQFGFLPEGAPLFEDLSINAHLHTLAGLADIPGNCQKRVIGNVIKQFDLMDVRHRIIDTLSKGYRRRVALAGACLGNPPLLFLDEPTDGLDPFQKDRVLEQLRQARNSQTLLISTHSLEDVEAICDRVIILHKGALVFDGNTEDMKKVGKGDSLKSAFQALLEEAGTGS